MFVLLRVAVGEAWYSVMLDLVRQPQPDYVCFTVETFNDYLNHGLMGYS